MTKSNIVTNSFKNAVIRIVIVKDPNKQYFCYKILMIIICDATAEYRFLSKLSSIMPYIWTYYVDCLNRLQIIYAQTHNIIFNISKKKQICCVLLSQKGLWCLC